MEYLTRIGLLATAIFLGGYCLGRMTAPGSNMDFLIEANRVRDAQIKKAEDGFENALTIYKNTNVATFDAIKADHARELESLKETHEQDMRLMRIAVTSCATIGSTAH